MSTTGGKGPSRSSSRPDSRGKKPAGSTSRPSSGKKEGGGRRPPRPKVANGDVKRTESPLARDPSKQADRADVNSPSNASSSSKKRPKNSKPKKPSKSKAEDKDIDAINAEINDAEKKRAEKKAERAEKKSDKVLKSTKSKTTTKKPEKPEEPKPTKIIIRNLPPCITSDALLQILEHGYLPPYNYYNFCAADASLIPWHTCRAYFNFKSPEEALRFYQNWDNYTFQSKDETLERSYTCEVEVAPHQKLPTDRSTLTVEKCASVLELRREMGISAKIFNSLEYNQYLGKGDGPSSTNDDDTDAAEGGAGTTAKKMEAFMEMLEQRKAEMDSTKKSPLCLFLEEERERTRPVRLKPTKVPKKDSSKKDGRKERAGGDGESEGPRRPPKGRGKGKGQKSGKRGGGGK